MKNSLLFSFGLVISTFCFSQKDSVSPHTLLWKVTGKNLSRPTYLFGTMHILCAQDAKVSDSLKKIIQNCDEIYFEIKLDDFSGMLKSLQFMRMNDNKKLSDLLNGEDYAKVKNYF